MADLLDPLVWLILLPLFWATGAFLLGPGRGAGLAIVGVALQLAFALQLPALLLAGGVRGHAVGGWGAPLGIDLAVDGLAAVMLLLTQVVALPLLLYARSYFAAGAEALRYFWPLVGFLLAGLNALFISGDLFNLYVTLELVGLAAVGLVAASGGAAQIAAALRYLFATLVGSGMYLLGVALIYGVYGTVSLATLTPLVTGEAPAAVWLAAALMLVGLMVKTAIFPWCWRPSICSGLGPISPAEPFRRERCWAPPPCCCTWQVCCRAGTRREHACALGSRPGSWSSLPWPPSCLSRARCSNTRRHRLAA